MAGTQCAKPTLIPSDATHATTSVMVRIATKTAGAYLRYTLDGSTPTGGLAGNGTQLAAESGKVSFTVGPREKTLKAIAYKPDWPIRRWQKELTSTVAVLRQIESRRCVKC